MTVTLISRDNVRIDVSNEAAKLSGLVCNTMQEDNDEDESVENTEVEVLRVSGACLQRVVDFMDCYIQEPMTEIPVPLGGNSFEEVCKQETYQNYMRDMDQAMVFDILAAANYMEVKPLLDLACLRITFMLLGRGSEEIRQILNLPHMTPEEEARARVDYRWIFEEA